MGDLLNNSNAIQSHIESLLELEENKSKKLQAEKDELTKKFSSSKGEVKLMDSIFITSSLIPGKKVFLKLNGSNLSLLQGKMKSVFKSPEKCLLRFIMTNGTSAVLRNNNDFNFMSYYCSANQINPVQIDILTEEELRFFTPTPEFDQPVATPTRVVLIRTPEINYGILMNLPDGLDFDKGKEEIFKVFHPCNSLVLTDFEGDDVEISSQASWEYLYEETYKQTLKGNYLKLTLK
ncbi:hypothetical protein TVAG_245900 [Trichomonas vaginalis G3]|uniref:Uncharacterized protein n=1 Tax=Trichomonas vaginalis (strain ATCC PRA-98 / G3) TaxID=412133 RepID=A2E4P8_TRIV3|nr:hypothetical protein TVAGG3_0862480 [Trichomonas vaginalis G3]EAY12358.1 hypothetical protein TVAG_245900 [Trichomonas vaginalis G3]KAI5500776.1 hypothetical protein TVAGG3_0862480 [Trichomonas vaginalis G3]|eukprot:XP_001324581.1 hypothetical protein [Trichomonas vaginalis G3]